MVVEQFVAQRMEVFADLTSQGGARRMSTAPSFSVTALAAKEKVISPGPWLGVSAPGSRLTPCLRKIQLLPRPQKRERRQSPMPAAHLGLQLANEIYGE